MINFHGNRTSFEYKVKITGKTSADGNAKDVKIPEPLKYPSSFWGTLGMSLTNCDIKLAITDTKLYAQFVTLSTQDNAKLLEQLKSGF